MPDPTPAPVMPSLPEGWKPTASTFQGMLYGGALAQIVIAATETLRHIPLSGPTAGAITTLSIGGISYLFKDGGRK